MNKLTGLKDLDREILFKVKDEKLFNVCMIDKRFWYDVCDDNFLIRRLQKYPGITKYKKEEETWKLFFLRVVHTISKMKEKFGYQYKEGDFKKQFDILTHYYYGGINRLAYGAAKKGELFLVIFAFDKGADLEEHWDDPFIAASENGHFEIVKYLVEKGYNVNKADSAALKYAAEEGRLNVVKYLVEKGANVHAEFDYALRWASMQGHIDIVKYLVEHGANIHTKDNEPLRWAIQNGKVEVAEYLRGL